MPLGAYSRPLSPGDEISLRIAEEDIFSGEYSLDEEGNLNLPFIDQINLLGLNLEEAKIQIRKSLIGQDIFKDEFLRLGLKRLRYAPIEVSVTGSVFTPGVQKILPADDNKRSLAMALVESGGITPYADVTKVELTRNSQTSVHNLLSLFKGETTLDPPLVSGDSIFVPKTNLFDTSLIRQSSLTPVNISIFVGGAQEGSQVQVPYSSRLSHASILSKCTGGSRFIFSPRSIVLARPNHALQHTEVSSFSVSNILRNPLDNTQNPYLIPHDTIVCLEAPLKSVNDLFGILGNLVNPTSLIYQRFVN
ncbi:polysaccharide biosynthesis/export family protein [Synechococcus sp. N32]|uniref:polysaccharide biosynthesis/export family protein n=1 Tax=Synechococcus sp. N32 TaxID=2575514 RepID=UPI00211092C3|nr:polysaccharide biosynthesis/export family protein [Synechococcus sp. N32]